MKITIDLDSDEVKVLKKRADKNFLDLKSQVEDIIRRSCINAINNKKSSTETKCDDKLVSLFSRQKRGKK